MEIILRAAAKAKNLKRYWTGVPCVHRHISERYTVTGQCVQCGKSRLEDKDRRQQNNAWSLQNYHAHKNDPEFWARKRCGAIRRYCKKHTIPFDLTPDYILSQIPPDRRCPVLGTPFLFGGPKLHPHGASIDRVFPTVGYMQGNVHVISWRANNLKRDSLDPEELRKVADYMLRCMLRN